jgi:COP9 signalosome complex subunit 6
MQLNGFMVGRMYGALLASQSGRDIDIINSFELPLSTETNGALVLDKNFLLYKLEQCKRV